MTISCGRTSHESVTYRIVGLIFFDNLRLLRPVLGTFNCGVYWRVDHRLLRLLVWVLRPVCLRVLGSALIAAASMFFSLLVAVILDALAVVGNNS